MRRKLLNLAFLFIAGSSYAQLGIGVTKPNSSSQLEVSASDKGVLIPRIPLISTTDQSTITSGNVNSLLVFNTSKTNDLTQGYYYWYEDRWVRIFSSRDLESILEAIEYDFSFIIEGDFLNVYDKEGDLITSVKVQDLNIVTKLVNNQNGTYTYTNESGVVSIIDVPASIINQFQDIINNTNVQEILNEYLVTNGGNVKFDGTSFTYIDSNGDIQNIDMSSIVKANETITTLVKDASGNGKYTYTNESGVDVLIDVPADVVSNFETIVNNTEVQEILNQIIKNVGGNVSYDGTSFTYVDGNGDTVVLDMSSIVKANETVTTLVDNGDGTYTYFNESSFDLNGVLRDDATGVTFSTSSSSGTNTWNKVNTTNSSFDQTDDVYRVGKVIIGKDASIDLPTTVNNVDLYVEGNIQTGGKFFTTNSVYADYVFEKYFLGDSSIKTTYEFTSLDYVKDFVANNFHLPGVTPISDLEKNSKGYQFDLTELSIQQLEKIEELFLHAIEFDERLDAKDKKMQELINSNKELLEKNAEFENRLNQLERRFNGQ